MSLAIFSIHLNLTSLISDHDCSLRYTRFPRGAARSWSAPGSVSGVENGSMSSRKMGAGANAIETGQGYR
jgi:hypothetical protein